MSESTGVEGVNYLRSGAYKLTALDWTFPPDTTFEVVNGVGLVTFAANAPDLPSNAHMRLTEVRSMDTSEWFETTALTLAVRKTAPRCAAEFQVLHAPVLAAPSEENVFNPDAMYNTTTLMQYSGDDTGAITPDEARERMQALLTTNNDSRQSDDYEENIHKDADVIMQQLLRHYGHADIADAFEKLDKWYS